MQQQINLPLNIAILVVAMTFGSYYFIKNPLVYAASQPDLLELSDDGHEIDPWEPFNEQMFDINYELDRYFLKHVSIVYDSVLPDSVQIGIKNAINNIGVIRRLVNNLLQFKIEGVGREVLRFSINSTIGVAGLFDVAKDGFGIQESDEDMGQTLAVYGFEHGPYLILPLLPVMTVRDGIGGIADAAMNPLNYIFPTTFAGGNSASAGVYAIAGVNAASAGVYVLDTINDRSINLDQFEQVEETAIDLYGAVRNAYFQRRTAAVAD